MPSQSEKDPYKRSSKPTKDLKAADKRDKRDGEKKDEGRRKLRPMHLFLLFLILAVPGYWVVNSLLGYSTIDTSSGLALLKSAKGVERVTIIDGNQVVQVRLNRDYVQAPRIAGESEYNAGKRVQFTYVTAQAKEVNELVQKANPKGGYDSVVPTTSWWSSFLQILLLSAVFLGAMWFVMGRMQGGSRGGLFSIGRSKSQIGSKEMPDVTFDDVAGVDEAVEELQEIREFLSEPAKFKAVGAKIPRGVLLYGPPGTGKTLLAKAVAGEAGVPFFSMSGSEFIEMFVGVGASRMRDLFEQAKAAAPAIIFVDEIDAVGRSRASGATTGGHDEAGQTLNQMLVEMDGFGTGSNVIVIAATNRPDVLDPALLRPGRFDRQVAVEAPDMAGRLAILKVHAKGKPMTDDVDLALVAKRTPGFTGAELANVLNEAALLTARANAHMIDNRALDEAIDRVIAGPQKRTRVMNDHEKSITAYHEAGHALCAAAGAYSDPVTKVTILPRGRALGYTQVMPSDDKYSVTRNELLDQLVYAMGGRAAEEIIFDDPTSGASNDIEKATAIARRMVTEYGMSDLLGTVRLGKNDDGDAMASLGGPGYSEAVSAQIDEQVRALVESAYQDALQILVRNRPVLDRLAQQLLKKETILEGELAQIFTPVAKQPKRPRWHGGELEALNAQVDAIADPDWEQLEAHAKAQKQLESGSELGSGAESKDAGELESGAEIESGAELEASAEQGSAAEINAEPAFGTESAETEETGRD